MATKIKPNVETPKKIYQQWWFWVIIVVLVLFVIGLASQMGKSINNTVKNVTTTTTQTEKELVIIKVPDFSEMTTEQINAWGEENSVKIIFSRDYSDTVAKDGFIKQSPEVGTNIGAGVNVVITLSNGKAPTTGERNALKSAESYLKYTSFSRAGLIKQLEYEGYSTDEATYGVDNVTVDWNEQAAKKAKSYLDMSSFSRDGLIKQLEYEGFTHEQAVYGVSQNGY